MWFTVLLLFILLFSILYYFSTRNFDYWEKRKVPHLKPLPFFGNYKDFILLKTFNGNVSKQICEQFPDEPCVGAFYGTEPSLLVQDPELLKIIMTKDFCYFNGREICNYVFREDVTHGLFFTHGDQWKVIRQNLTPLFSTAKMKNMFPLIKKCTEDLDEMLNREVGASNCLEANELCSRYTTDATGTCSFGIDINMLNDYENNPFREMLTLIFGFSTYRALKNNFRAIWPKIFYGMGFQIFPPKVTKVMLGLVTAVFKARNYKPSSRNDFVDLILSFKTNDYLVGDSISSMKSGESKKIYIKADDEILASQTTVLYAGSSETSATTLALTLFELAKNQDAQIKIQNEVDEYLRKRDGEIEYDCTTELPYASACVSETLRLYPVFSNLTREVMEDYTFSNGLQLDKGIRIHIPVYYIHRSPKNFPKPDLYRPERFLSDEVHKIKPFTYLPFGEGPRNCIGMRFAKMQVNAALVAIFKNYNVHLADGMSEKVDFQAGMLLSHTNCDVNLRFERRKNY